MPKLKSLRGAVGSYGRVAANGIVDVSEAEAEKLLKTKRFVRASDADIKAAQERQKADLAMETAGAAPGFSAMPAKPDTKDRLSRMVETGQIDRDKARELVALQISLSSEEVQAFINAEAEHVFAEIAERQRELDQLERTLSDREDQLAKREADLDARENAPANAPTVAAKRDTAQPEAGAKADAEAEAETPAEDARKAAAKEKGGK